MNNIFAQESPPAITATAPEAEADVFETASLVNKNSYSRLAHPSVANRLGLDDEQRAKVQAIMAERAQLLAAAPKEQWEAIVRDNETKLENLLTPAQKANWLKVINEKTIRLIFRYHSWEDVLNWFADQVGMQLVMDAPPPGTLNYTSPEELTPTEALDKINGILQINGYTLLRNDQMLILFNLKRNNGRIPPQYVPKITPEDLADRGTFEYVAVTFPLGRRDSATVQNAFQPFQGPYGQIVPLPGNTLLITDTAGSLQLINRIIYSIAEPPVPAPGEDPRLIAWKSYSVEKANPQQIEEIIKSFLPAVTTVRMPNSSQIHALALPSQHGLIEQLIQRMDADPNVHSQAVVEVYSFEDVNDEVSMAKMWRVWRDTGVRPDPYSMEPGFIQDLIETISKIAPNAVVSYDKGIKKLVVYAVPEEQAIVKELIDKLKSGPSGEDAVVLKIYKMTSVSKKLGQEITKAIESLAPKATITFDATKNRFFIVASTEEHKKIVEAFSELEAGVIADDRQKLVCYPVTTGQRQRFSQLFRQLSDTPEFEGAEELRDARQNQLTIWATDKQHEEIRKILNELSGAGEGSSTGEPGANVTNVMATEAFVLRRTHVAYVHSLIPQIVPGVTAMPEYATNSVIVHGTRDALDQVRDFVEKLNVDTAIDVLVFPLSEPLPQQALEAIQAGLSRVGRILFDEKNMRLLIYGTSSDLALAEKVVNGIVATDTHLGRSMRVQTVDRDFPDQVVDFIKRSFPRADIQFDRNNKQFTIAAAESDQLLAAKLIKETEQTLPPDEELRFYRLEQVASENLIDLIKNDVKNIASIERDAQDPTVLRLKARPATHDAVQKLLDRIKNDLPTSASKEMHSYPMSATERKRFDLLKDDLFREIGDVRVMTDDRQNMLTIWALPSQHQRIEAVLEGLRQTTPEELQDELLTCSLKFTDLTTATNLLKDIYSEQIKITEDKNNGRLIIRTPKPFVTAIETLLQQLDTPDPNQTKRYWATYQMGSVYTYDATGNYRSPYTMVVELQQIVPNAKVSYDYINAMIVIWGTEEEHQVISEMLSRVHDVEASEKFGRFPLRRADVSMVIATLQRLYPTAVPSYDPAGKTLIVQAINPAQLKLIKALMQKIDPVEPGPNDLEIRFYQLNTEPLPYLITTLQRLAPEATFVPDTQTHQLMVLARPGDQELVKKNVDSIVATFIPEERMLFIYQVTDNQRKRLEEFIKTASRELKDLEVMQDDTPGQIAIWGKPSEHRLIADVLMQMQSGEGSDSELILKSFSLTSVDQATVEEALKAAIPEARPIFDAKGSRLLVLADKPNMQKVTDLLLQFDPNSTKNLRHFVYEIAVGDPETILESIKLVYPNIKSTLDTRNRRIMIWASPEEHAAIAEMIEQVNKDSDAPLKEKFVSYPTPRLSYFTVTTMLKALFPDTDVYADPYSQHVTVRALSKEHEQIKAILEQMQSADHPYYAKFAVLPMGEADPLTIESMLQGMFPDAESLTPLSVLELLDPDTRPDLQRLYSRQRINNRDSYNYRNRVTLGVLTSFDKGCFKVDPQTKSVMLFLPEEELQRATEAIESIAAMSQMGGAMSVKSYNVTEGYYWTVLPFVKSVAPTAKITEADTGSFVAYATESDHKKIAKVVEEFNQESLENNRFQMTLLYIPDGSTVDRRMIVRTLNQGVLNIYTYSGAQPNQIVVYARPSDLTKVQKLFDDVMAQSEEVPETQYRVYSIKYIAPYEAVMWLRRILPNINIESDLLDGAPTVRRLVIQASAKEHDIIASTLEMIDADLSEDVKPVPQEYNFAELPRYTVYYCYASLLTAFPYPQAVFTPIYERDVIVALASPRTHEEIRNYIDTYIAQKKDEYPHVEFYVLEKSSVYKMQSILYYAIPGIVIVPGTAPNQMAIYAKPKEHERIKELIAQSETMVLPEGVGPSLKLYPLPTEKCVTMANLIRPNMPNAIIYPIPIEGYLLVYGTEEEHKYVEQASDAVAKAFPEPLIKTYFTKHLPLGEAYSFLAQQFTGRAIVHLRSDTGDLLVSASEDVHLLIQKTLAEIDIRRPEESERVPVAYDFGELVPFQRNWAWSTMLGTVPAASYFPSSELSQWIIFAKPYEHEKIRSILDEILAKRAVFSMETYTIKKTTAMGAWSQVIATIAPESRPGFSSDPHQLMIWAKTSDHEKIQEAVEKMNADDPNGIFARAYRFQKVSLGTAYGMISPQVPGITFSFDPVGNLLLITATPEEHEKIEQIVKALDIDDPETQISLRVHRTENIDGTTLQQLLRIFYSGHPAFNILYDPNNNTLTALATSQQHQYIESLIKQILTGALVDPDLKFEVYDFTNMNFYPVWRMLYQVFDERGLKINFSSYDSSSNKMIVRAKPEEHRLISLIMETYRPEEKEMDVFTLKQVDPDSAQMAIQQMFSTLPYTRMPQVRVDTYSNQIYVNGTKEQLEQIRALLIRMGESNLSSPIPTLPTPSHSGSGAGNIRTIRIQGDNTQELLDEIERRWSQSNGNRNPLVIQKPVSPETTEESPPPDQGAPQEDTTSESKENTHSFFLRAPQGFCAEQGVAGTEGPAVSVSTPPVTSEHSPEGSPIYISVNEDGSLNVASMDTAALDQFEDILAQANSRAVIQGRDFTYYSVKNTAPSQLVQRLQQIMYHRLSRPRSSYSYSRYGMTVSPATPQVEILADNLNNMIFVRGPQTIRDEIEELIIKFDVQDPIMIPRKVQLKNLDAAQAFQQIQRVFARQLMMARLPGGAPVQMFIEQSSNSISITAPKELEKVLVEYAEKIDEDSIKDESRKIHVHALKDVNSQVINAAIRQLYGTNQQRYGYPYYTTVPVVPYSTYPYNPSYGRAPGY